MGEFVFLKYTFIGDAAKEWYMILKIKAKAEGRLDLVTKFLSIPFKVLL